MKFDDSPLKQYLVEHLQPLTPADPVILADYIIALLTNDKPLKELQDLCAGNLVDFLGQSTESFVSKLFLAIQNGPVALPVDNSKISKNSETAPDELEQVELKPSKDEEHQQIKEEVRLSSGNASESDELEVSDDDDDRNHKHRKRVARHPSFHKNDQGRAFRKPYRKFDKTGGDRKPFDFGQSVNRPKCDTNSSLEKNNASKFEKKYPGTTSFSQAPQEIGPRTRFRNDSGPRFDSSASAPRPAGGRGRGRASGHWNQHDSRFGPLGTIDLASHMMSQASTHPGMFMGATMSSVAGAQPASWGAFGFIPGMGNGCLDPVNPLGLQGTLHPPLNPQRNLNIPRQRCRDFEEQGFCLRGDMCPMEHGVNRIVVEDVQSLSQFNLPVSLPSSRVSGQAGPGTSTPITSSSLPATSKSMPSKISKSSAADEVPGFNGVLSSAVTESDVYDPDQPLWNNSNPERSNSLPVDPSCDGDDNELFWDDGPSEFHRFKSLDAEQPSSSVGDIVSHRREHTSSGKRLKVSGGTEKKPGDISHIEQAKRMAVNTHSDSVLGHGVFTATVEGNHMTSNSALTSRFRKDKLSAGKTSQKALRTLFVNGIPQKNNKREALFSHFKKFGSIVDIYIPMKSEKAFVQFSSREEAEAALKAPDAVMGNRFIKLFWANRDNLSDEQIGREVAESVSGFAKPALSVPSKPSAGDVKESSPSLALKAGSIPLDTSIVSPVPKPLRSNLSKLPLTQKKRESLEALKEELRRKQESLDKKRNEFRNQLDKLEKQTMSAKKSGPVLENVAKKQKVEKEVGVTNMPVCESGTDIKEQQHTHMALEMSCSESNLLLTDAKELSLIAVQSPKGFSKNNDHPPSLNTSEGDNATGFRVLPPLPASLANLSTLEEHFSTFHDLSLVELEEQENTSSSHSLKQSSNCSAIIMFTTRESAEKAFRAGASWQGHDLKFSWLTTSDSGTIIEVTKNLSSPGTIEMPDGDQSLLLNPGSSLPGLVTDTSCLEVETGKHPDDGGIGHHCELLDVKSSNDPSVPEKCMLYSSAPTIEDDHLLDTSQ